jgi:hypothetical protein
MLISWIVFPLVLGLIALGCGLLLERASGIRLPGTLLLPAGLAVVVVVGLFPLMGDSTAELTTPALVVIAALGLVLSPPWRRGRIDLWAAACALGVFAVYAAPVVLSGQPTFASYLPQVDAGTWFGLTDHIMNHGRNIAGVPNSNYWDILNAYLPGGYPLGSFVPLGAGSKLLNQDPAWLFQPYLAFLAAMLALSLYALSSRLFASPRLRALVAFIASQPALLFGIALWSGVKELSGAWVLALLGALILPLVPEGTGARRLLPICVASAATLGLLSFAGAIWLIPLLAGALVLALRLRGSTVALTEAAAVAAVTALLSIPTLAEVGSFLPNATSAVVTGGGHALLFHPLSWRQLFAIWPAGDFRGTANNIGLTDVLVGLVAVAAAAGLVWAWRSRRWELLLYTGGAGLGCLAIVVFGSPWVDAKALAMLSPAIALAAFAGVFGLASLANRGSGSQFGVQLRRFGPPVGAVLIAGGVLWSNALAFHDVTIAPRGQLRELQTIGEKYAGKGPTLLTDYEPYAARHFLRDLDVQGTSGLRSFRIPIGGNRYFVPRRGDNRIDTEAFDINALLGYQLIVRRHYPAASFPSYAYKLVWGGRYWEVWQRIEGVSRIVRHIALGGSGQPFGKPKCSDVKTLARSVGKAGVLAFSLRPRLGEAELAPVPVWESRKKGTPVPDKLRSGVVKGTVEIPATHRYTFWMSGVFDRRVQVLIDGKALAKPRREYVFSYPIFVFMGGSRLSKGTHAVEVRYGDDGKLHPGTGGRAAIAPRIDTPRPLLGFSPLTFMPDAPWKLYDLKPSRARNLCGHNLDWVEGIAPGAPPSGTAGSTTPPGSSSTP